MSDKDIECSNCGWGWKASESDIEDLYMCHKCGYDNKNDMGKMTNRALMEKFIIFCRDYLELTVPFNVHLTNDREDITTSAYYDIQRHYICVYIKDRAIMDVMRSVAHELVHHCQNQNGQLTGNAEEGADGSPIENEANAKAGEIMRVFGKQNPEIYTNNK
jgi:Zn-dependent peptidase ImmA (M78 family)